MRKKASRRLEAVSSSRPRAVSPAGRILRGHPKGLALIGPAHGGILVGHALPEETEALWDWRLTQDADTLIKLLAYCVTCTVKPARAPTRSPQPWRSTWRSGGPWTAISGASPRR
jgi:hypothetical protein